MATAAEISDIDPLLRIKQVMQLVPLSASHIYRLIRAGRFPAPVKLGESCSAWRKAEIVEWMANPTEWTARAA